MKGINLTSITLKKVNKSFKEINKGQSTQLHVLKDIDLEIKLGEFISIVGPSGCGKSTLLRIIAGLETPDTGNVTLPQRRSMVFQSSALLPWLSAEENVLLPLSVHNLNPKEALNKAEKLLQLMKLTKLKNFHPRELSGGQKQRVGIARALMVDPELLILDEPFSALDTITQEELHQDLLNIWRELNMTIIMVSHSIEEAVLLSDRVCVMSPQGLSEVPILLSRPRVITQVGFISSLERIKRKLSS